MQNAKLSGACLFMLMTLFHSLGISQTTTATLTGIVTDESGAVLPQAELRVTNTATGVARTVATDAAGRYLVSQLPPGPYELVVTMAGFDTLARRGITLALGQEASLTLTMRVGSVNEQVTVTGEAPVVNTSTSALTAVMEQKRILELPLNSRDFKMLALVQPGVSNGRRTTGQLGTLSISMSGSRPEQTGYLLDGTNIKSGSGAPSNAANVMLGVESVQEFQVLTSNYSAEFGGSSGGLMSMITKSGTNQLHGSLYYSLRNSALDARDFFVKKKDVFARNQFGGAAGGPVKREHTFFFFNYEGLLNRQTRSAQVFVPDDNTHLGRLPNGTQVQVAQSIRPYLDLWPRANGPLVLNNGLPTGSATLNSSGANPITVNYYQGRVDQQITDEHSIFTRVTFDRGSRITPGAFGEAYSSTNASSGKSYATVQHQYIITPRLVASTRMSFNRSTSQGSLLLGGDYPQNLKLILDLPPSFTFPGVTRWDPATAGAKGADQVWQFQETIAYVRGAHSIKAGVDIQQLRSNSASVSDASLGGNLGWNTLQDFLTDARMSTLEIKAGGSSHRSFTQKVFGLYFQDDWTFRRGLTLNLGVRYEPFTTPAEKHNRVSVVKDWVHATSFDVGVPFWDNPSLKNFSPRVGFAWDPTGAGKTAVRGGFGLFDVLLLPQHYSTPATKNPPFIATIVTVQGNLATVLTDVARVAPTVMTPVMSPDSFMEITQWDLDTSYEMKMNLSVERQLGQNLSVSASYIGGRGVHLWRNLDVNTVASIEVDGRPFVIDTIARTDGYPALLGQGPTLRVNPNTGVGTSRASDAQSFYNALQLQVKKRLSRGLQLGGWYTWSKNVDDTTTSTGNLDFNDFQTSQPYNPKSDRARSSLHIGQNMVVNGVYQIPSLIQSGFASHLLGGWQVSSIFSASDGVPFATLISGRNAPDKSRSTGRGRPDLVAGRSNRDITSGTTAGCTLVNGIPGPYNASALPAALSVAPGQKLGTPELYFDPCAFRLPPAGFYGNEGRNILVGPGLVNFDFSLLKSVPLGIGEGTRLEFRADIFNIFNRTQFSIPSTAQVTVLNPAPAARSYIASAGRISTTANPPRSLQFGLKVSF